MKLLIVSKELSDIEELFSNFQHENQEKLNGRPVFKHGSKVFEDALRLDSISLIAGLEKEISAVKEELK
jgi:hypothetical protein